MPVDTVWDVGSVIYDIGKITVGWSIGNDRLVVEGTKDLIADAISVVVPYVPAGSTKLARAGANQLSTKADDAAARGLEMRGVRPEVGTRTFQGQVDAATKGGANPTIQRGGQDLVRLRSTGHGRDGASATPQNVRRQSPDGRLHVGKGADRELTNRDMRELHKAQTGQGSSRIRTRGG